MIKVKWTAVIVALVAGLSLLSALLEYLGLLNLSYRVSIILAAAGMVAVLLILVLEKDRSDL